MKLNLTRALLLFIAAYIVVSILATALSVAYASYYNSPPPPPGVTVLKSASFLATVPYHVLIMFITWPLFAWIYFKKSVNKTISGQTKETWQLALLWLVAAIVVDLVCFVLISHPYSFSAHEFYIDYQPWISMIYFAIFLSPWIYRKISQLRGK